MHAQLDFTNNRYKRVNLIGGKEIGIIPALIEQYPNDFVNLEGREDVPQDTFDWYYDTEADRFIQVKDLPQPEPEPVKPPEPTNSEVLQTMNDLRAEMEIAGVI